MSSSSVPVPATIGGQPGTAAYNPATGNVGYNVVLPSGIGVAMPLPTTPKIIAGKKNITGLTPADQAALDAIGADTAGQNAAIGAANLAGNPPTVIPSNAGLPNPANPANSEAAIADKTTSTTNTDAAANKQTIGPNTTTPTNILPNPLHNYGSYTYSLTLSALTLDEFSRLSLNPLKPFTPTNVLFSSAGKYPTPYDSSTGTGNRNQFFTNDFFFEKLEFQTIIGLTSQNENSNAMTGAMTIIEPYGMTLLNGLLKLGQVYQINYLQMPYLLTIDFFGYDDNGDPQKIKGITKYIPILLTGIKLRITEKGSTYDITTIPYNHEAYSQTVASTPAKFEVTASNIVDFFLTNTKVNVTDSSISRKEVVTYDASQLTDNERQYQINNKIAGRPSPAKPNKVVTDTSKVTFVVPTPQLSSKYVKSYTGAFNSWKKALLLPQEEKFADIIKFEIDSRMVDNGMGDFPPKELIDKESISFNIVDPAHPDAQLQNGFQINKSDNTMSICVNEGTSIIEVIKLAITNTRYIRDQIIDISKEIVPTEKINDWKTKPLNWFKVSPRLELGPYDDVRNRFQKTITYRIEPYAIVNTKSIQAPQGNVDTSFICKEYDYIFTGKNNDILNFDLNFDTQYFVVEQAAPEILDSIANSQKKTASEDPKTNQTEENFDQSIMQQVVLNNAKGSNALKPKFVRLAGTTGQSANNDTKATIIKQVAKNVLTTSGGDQLSIKLRIIGDPDFIKQDDFFYGSEHREVYTAGSAPRDPSGSLVTDANELFINLTFKTGSDYNSDGLEKVTNAGGSAGDTEIVFSGLYKILTVTNFFSNGKFEQELDLVRQPNQPTPGFPDAPPDNQRTDNPPVTSPKVLTPVENPTNNLAAIEPIPQAKALIQSSGVSILT